MADEKEKRILIISLMIFVLICMLSSLVVFGQMSFSQIYTPPPAYGFINGTVYYKDGVTPLVINDTSNGDYLQLEGPTRLKMVTDANGYFTSINNVAPGQYALYVYRNSQNIGYISFLVDNGQTVTENVTTSRTPTTKI